MPNRSRLSLSAALLLAITAILASPAPAQPAQKGPAAAIALSKTVSPYDVVSIRQNKSDDSSWTFNYRDNMFTGHNISLESVMTFAYDIKADLITGLSGPVAAARFDIQAKVLPSDAATPLKTSDDQLQAKAVLMLQDRFHLKVHLETKTLPVYELVVAKGGLKFKLDQTAGTNSNTKTSSKDATETLTATDISIANLADILSNGIHRQVIDKTNLPGHASFTLKWTDEVAADQDTPNTVSIFTAIQDQLGLKLKPSKGPVETLVIDHVEMPTAN